MAAYAIVLLTITDEERYGRYRTAVAPTIVAGGGRLVVVDDAADVVEGSTDAERFILIEFPDRAAAHRWHASPEYLAIVADRLEGATTHLFAVVQNSPETQARLDASNAGR